MVLRLFGSFLAVAASAVALASQDPNLFTPMSSIERPADIGNRVHTNVVIWTGPAQLHERDLSAPGSPNPLSVSGISGYHPSDIIGAYGVKGSGSGAIAIVDAFDYPAALSDFDYFSSTFGLPTESSSSPTANNKVFQVVYTNGQPSVDSGWNVEAALDIEWAHAMAPKAKIYLVETTTNNWDDMMAGVAKARTLPGVTQISMSWGGGEYGGETSYDSFFAPHVLQNQTFFASSGDWGAGVIYPSASPYVVAAGGTSLYVSNGVWQNETGWGGSGGGPSTAESRPVYQSAIASIVGAARGVPDIAAVADPYTGVAIRIDGNWWVVGGTSVASPVLAGIANAGGAKRSGTELMHIYSATTGFRDITVGSNGYPCLGGWDFVTGWGSPFSSASL
jgi:subtilase family serine protease